VNQIIAPIWSQRITGSPNYVLETKLKIVKNELKALAKINHNESQ